MTQQNEPTASPDRVAHTPGPWSLSQNNKHPWAVLCPTNFPKVMGVVCTVSYRPNALLIAAAPEMLEALEAFVDANRRYREVNPNGDRDPVDDAADIARAAIAKANGAEFPKRLPTSEDDFATRALQRAIEFLDDEAEQRSAAGSDMSDYATEPKDIGTDLRTVLHNLKGGAA